MPEDVENVVVQVSSRYPGKPIIVILLEKRFERCRDGIRSKNEYYMGVANRIVGRLYMVGKLESQKTLYEEKRD